MPKVSDAHLEARRQQIIDAALACFAREGFHRTTMQDIFDEAGLSPGAIYSYFASKDELIEALTAQRHERERERLQQAAGEDAAAALRSLAEAFYGGLREPEAKQERRVGIQMWAESLRNTRIRRLARRGIDEPRVVLAEVIRTAQAEGTVSTGFDADSLARLMIAAFQGLILQQVWDEKVDVDRYLETLERLMLLVMGDV